MEGNDSVLVFAAEVPPQPAPQNNDTLSRRVSVEAIKANMAEAMAAVGAMADAASTALAKVDVVYLDVELAVGVDGSIGLLGTGVNSSVKGTVTVRIAPRPAMTRE